jgi:PIN domain nuclease of toxin-antitoxin system
MSLVLDTCAAIWSILAPESLSMVAAKAITDEAGEVFVSPINCTEIACAVERGRHP